MSKRESNSKRDEITPTTQTMRNKMKLLTRTTTIRLHPSIYEQVTRVAQDQRQHPTALMRQAISEYDLMKASMSIAETHSDARASFQNAKFGDLQKKKVRYNPEEVVP